MKDETVVGYIDNITAFGIIAPIRRSLVVTNKRILILDVSSTSSTSTSAGYAFVFGIFGRGAANQITKDQIQETTKKLSQSNLEELLKSNTDNVAIDNANIKNIMIDRKNISINTNEKTYKYALSNPDVRNKTSDVYDSYVRTLQKVLGDNVVTK